MIHFVTIDTLIKDLLFIIRGSKVSQSETITWNQIEAWIHQYRGILIKQDLDKGKVPNPDYIQEIPVVKLVKTDRVGDFSIEESDRFTYRTEIQIPKSIDLNFRSGITFVGTLDGCEIQFSPRNRAYWKKFRKYTNRDAMAYLRNGYIYLETPYALSYISIRGIFEVPTEINNLINPLTNLPLASYDDVYPIPINMIPILKEMILKKEANIIVNSASDDKNDGSNKVEGNVVKDA